MTKTIKQWLETLKEPYRTEALNNLVIYNDKENTNSLADAVKLAFIWSDSNQGYEYWDNLHSLLLHSERFKD